MSGTANERKNRNYSRISLLIEGDLNHKLNIACERSRRSKRAELTLRLEDSFFRFKDVTDLDTANNLAKKNR